MKRIKNQSAITKEKPTWIGSKGGIHFYEHPFYGDESPLIAKINGTWFLTDEWEL